MDYGLLQWPFNQWPCFQSCLLQSIIHICYQSGLHKVHLKSFNDLLLSSSLHSFAWPARLFSLASVYVGSLCLHYLICSSVVQSLICLEFLKYILPFIPTSPGLCTCELFAWSAYSLSTSFIYMLLSIFMQLIKWRRKELLTNFNHELI